jgi:hypothetical protein
MKMLDRSRIYSEVTGSFNGYEQDGILFLKNGMPFGYEKEELKEQQKKEEITEIKEQTEKNTKQVEKPAAKKLEEKPVKKRRGRPPKKKVVIVSEMETLPETHFFMAESHKQKEKPDQHEPTLEQTQIIDDYDDGEVII